MVTKKVSKKTSQKVVSKKSEVSPKYSKDSKDVKNVVSIVLGAISIVFAFFFPYGVAITGVLGTIFAYTEKGKVSKKASLWALILNLIGIFLAIIILSLSFIALLAISSGQLSAAGIA